MEDETEKLMKAQWRYALARADKRAAYERCNRADAALEMARIKERLAEIMSQHEPLASLLSRPMSERDRLYAAAYYVVVGRPWEEE